MTTDGNGDDPDWLTELAALRGRPVGTGPRGRAVSSALILPPGVLPHDLELRALLATIDAVHGDGELPPLPVRWGIPSNSAVAEYTATADLTEAVSLTIDSRRARWVLATAHEIGHFLDHQGIDSPTGFASRESALLNDWRTATYATSAYQALVEHPDTSIYLGQPEELWARS